MIQYCIEVTIAWTLFYGIYLIFLKRETFFIVNRWYLMHTAWIGALIPLSRFIPLPVMQEHSVMMEPVQVIHYTTYAVSEAMSAAPEQGVINMRSILMSLYILGVVFFSLRFMYGLRNIYRLWKSGEKVKNEGFTLVLSDKYHLPFSFLNCVFLHRSFLENESIKEILDHEMIHVKGRHTIDVLFMEILSIMFWWNPIIYLYKRELRQTHEYVADAYASQHTYKKNYGRILLGQSSSGIELALTNQFFNSHLKKRITMLYKKKSAHYKLSKYLLVIPVLFFLCVLYSFQDKESVDEQISSEKIEIDNNIFIDSSLPDSIAQELKYALDEINENAGSYQYEYLRLKKYRHHIDAIQSAFIEKAKSNSVELTIDDNSLKSWCISAMPMPQTVSNDQVKVKGIKAIKQTVSIKKSWDDDEVFLIDRAYKFQLINLEKVENWEPQVNIVDKDNKLIPQVKATILVSEWYNEEGNSDLILNVKEPISRKEGLYLSISNEGQFLKFPISTEDRDSNQVDENGIPLKLIKELNKSLTEEIYTMSAEEAFMRNSSATSIYSRLRIKYPEHDAYIKDRIERKGLEYGKDIVLSYNGGNEYCVGSSPIKDLRLVLLHDSNILEVGETYKFKVLNYDQSMEGLELSFTSNIGVVNMFEEEVDESKNRIYSMTPSKESPEDATGLITVRYNGQTSSVEVVITGVDMPEEKQKEEKSITTIYMHNGERIEVDRDATISVDGSIVMTEGSEDILEDYDLIVEEDIRVIDFIGEITSTKKNDEESITPAEQINENTEGYKLYQNVPNPFKDKTTIKFVLPQKQQATISIFNIENKVVKEYSDIYEKGENQIVVSKEDLEGVGVYYYQIESGDFDLTRKMKLIEKKD